jgi:hypothetical protein
MGGRTMPSQSDVMTGKYFRSASSWEKKVFGWQSPAT